MSKNLEDEQITTKAIILDADSFRPIEHPNYPCGCVNNFQLAVDVATAFAEATNTPVEGS